MISKFNNLNVILFSYALLAISIKQHVNAHGYMKTPRSRNYVAYEDGVWSEGGTSNLYYKESCPHCANRGGSLARCGLIGNRNFDVPLSITNDLMPADPQATYQRGDIITVDIILTAHHKGHFVFKACPIQHGDVPLQECFNQYPLEFVSDPLYGAPKDENYVTRAYIAPREFSRVTSEGSLYRFNVKLPDTLSGDLVLLQWHYLTANTCSFIGYSDYSFPSEWGISYTNALCDLPLPHDGNGAPEQFWNCAEISIVDGPVDPSTSPPIPAPAASNPSNSFMDPYPSPITNVPCGNGNVGNGICMESTKCCSEWGYCGTTPTHCRGYNPPSSAPNDKILAAPLSEIKLPSKSPTRAPTLSPTFNPTLPNCGNGNIGNGICANLNSCCSKYGFCGSTEAHCQNSAPSIVPATSSPPVSKLYSFQTSNSLSNLFSLAQPEGEED